MKNKILLASATLLSALMVAACGNGEKKATETVTTPTTEATTATPTTTAQTTTTGVSSDAKEVSLADTQRVGSEKVGYINIPKDWIAYKAENSKQQFQYSSTDKYNVLSMNAYTKETVKLGDNETFSARLIADRLYNYWQKEKDQTSLQGVKAKFAGEDSFLMKVSFSDGKHLYEWVFQKGDKVYTIAIEGTADMINTLRPVFEQSFSLDPKTPGN